MWVLLNICYVRSFPSNVFRVSSDQVRISKHQFFLVFLLKRIWGGILINKCLEDKGRCPKIFKGDPWKGKVESKIRTQNNLRRVSYFSLNDWEDFLCLNNIAFSLDEMVKRRYQNDTMSGVFFPVSLNFCKMIWITWILHQVIVKKLFDR